MASVFWPKSCFQGFLESSYNVSISMQLKGIKDFIFTCELHFWTVLHRLNCSSQRTKMHMLSDKIVSLSITMCWFNVCNPCISNTPPCMSLSGHWCVSRMQNETGEYTNHRILQKNPTAWLVIWRLVGLFVAVNNKVWSHHSIASCQSWQVGTDRWEPGCCITENREKGLDLRSSMAAKHCIGWGWRVGGCLEKDLTPTNGELKDHGIAMCWYQAG